jgi:hypothetical protein
MMLAPFLVCCAKQAAASGGERIGAGTETIVIIRHGEKPEHGLGQLTCKGLNRALALPKVLGQFGTPAAIYAPNPAIQMFDNFSEHTHRYSYVRPLATIEPTAIQLGMPVDTQFGYADYDGLHNELTAAKYRNATIFVVWEHHMAVNLAKALLSDHGGDPGAVPTWPRDDFDSIYVITITTDHRTVAAAFSLKHEYLSNRISPNCP